MDAIQTKGRRIAILIALLAIAALAWQWKFRTIVPAAEAPQYKADPTQSSGTGFNLQPLSPGFGLGGQPYITAKPKGPAPETFAQFSYAGGQSVLMISDVCQDAYYVILVFPISVDYRSSPASSVYNSANACEKDSVISSELDLSALHIAAGNYYYFVADQGISGSWYNPR